MRFGQFPFQVLFVDLLRVPVLVHVQIKGLSQREVLLVGDVRLGEVVLVHGLSGAQGLVEDLLHRLVVVRLEEAQTGGRQIVLELPVKVDRGEAASLQRVILVDFELLQVDCALLFVQHEYMAVVAGALRRERTEIWNHCLSFGNLVSFDVCPVI